MKKILKMPLRRMVRRTPAAEPLRARASANSAAYEKEDYEVEEEPNMKFSHALLVVLALHVIAVGGVFAFNSIKATQSATAKTPSKEGAAPTPEQTVAHPKPPLPENIAETWQGRTHTVQAGDTLTRLASLYKTSVEAIENENGITSYSMIRVGQILKIPAAKTEPAKPATDPATAAAKHAFLAAKSDLPKPATTKADPPKPAAATPAAKPLAQQAPPKKEDALPPASSPDTYVVAKGDNPYSIAKKLHVNYNELIAINEIKDPTRVQIGQKLKIPPRKN